MSDAIEVTTARTINAGAPVAAAGPVVIPGYELVERIGAGGYGEVWSALAPGGVRKALKIVYGNVDESRAETELKSLERIKDARHPFLLVLERFDIVDGRLVIVTELADCSLKDRCDEFRAKGKPGIPRSELVDYVRDAADALDYMYEKHGLAHLDVKPENILLVGGRSKVADFGLTKDISGGSVSVMSGLTPLYAPPELFEGRACRQSDQYSLAVVYHLLLTGEPPFSGRTAAQLTAQHLHSTPSLSALPPSDRATIARALAKKPTHRFATCREMVDELVNRPSRRRQSTPAPAPGRTAASRRVAVADDAASQIAARFGQPGPAAAADRFPPLPTPIPRPDGFPALVIGVGSLGRRILDRISPVHTEMLLIDIDADDVNRARRNETEGGPALHPVAMPLRSSSDYRSDSAQWLEWIDRRWLYNVPRSLRTEGIRPLGRLACLDNADAIGDAVRARLEEFPHPGEDATDTPDDEERPLPTLTVVVVGASSGGTASGSVIDLAAIARRVGLDAGWDIDAKAVVVHAKRPNTVNGDLADANTLSLLSELRHTEAEARRDRDDGLDRTAGFSSVHLVDAGDDGNEEAVEVAVRTASSFVNRLIDSPLGPISAEHAAGNPVEIPTIGTIGFAGVPSVDREARNLHAARIAHAVVDRWTSPLPEEQRERAPTVVAAFLAKQSLTPETVGPKLAAVLERTISGCRQFLDRAAVGDTADRARMVERLFEAADSDGPTTPWVVLRDDLRVHFEAAADEIAQSVLALVDRPGVRFGAAMAMLGEVERVLAGVRSQLAGVVEQARAQVPDLRGDTISDSSFDEFVLNRSHVAAASLLHELIGEVSDEMSDVSQSLARAASGFRDDDATGGALPERVVDEADRRYQAMLDARGIRFGRACETGQSVVHTLLESVTRALATESMIAGLFASIDAEGRTELLKRMFASARPRLPVRGAVHLVVVAPSPALGKALVPPIPGVSPIVVVDPSAEPGVLWVTDGVPFGQAARRFVSERPAVLEMADRLHTRVDVDWRA